MRDAPRQHKRASRQPEPWVRSVGWRTYPPTVGAHHLAGTEAWARERASRQPEPWVRSVGQWVM